MLVSGAIEKAGPAERLDALAEAAVLCGAGLQAAGKTDDAVAVYAAVLAADVVPQRRAEAVRGTIIAKGQDGIPLLGETLRSPVKRLANMAVYTARDLGRGAAADGALAAAVDRAILEEIEAATSAEAPQRAVVLLDVLAERNAGGASEAVTAGLARAAESSRPKAIRLAAIEALGRAGDAAVVGPLLVAAADEDPGIADTARAAVATLSAQPSIARSSSGSRGPMQRSCRRSSNLWAGGGSTPSDRFCHLPGIPTRRSARPRSSRWDRP